MSTPTRAPGTVRAWVKRLEIQRFPSRVNRSRKLR